MSGRIIPLHTDDHLEAQSLLPWYLTGRLASAETARVEAHLSTCAECQSDLKFERRLHAEIAALPIDVEQGWLELRRRLSPVAVDSLRGPTLRDRLVAAWRAAGKQWLGGEAWRGWALAAPAILILFAAALALPGAQPRRYHALAAAPAVAVGNALVIFRPDTRERDLRAALEAGHARLVDGPTAADAYVIRVPTGQRAAVLSQLRRRSDVELAEPIDSGGSP